MTAYYIWRCYMKQFGLVFEVTAAAGGRFTDGAGVDRRARFRLKVKKEKSARAVRREAKAAVRAALAEHGLAPATPGAPEDTFGFRAAIHHSPLVDCPRCHVILREALLVNGVCEGCAYGGDL